jgi:hypothetical protein
MSTRHDKPEQRLARVAAWRFFPGLDDAEAAPIVRELRRIVSPIFATLSSGKERELQAMLARVRFKPAFRAPPGLVDWLLENVGRTGLARWLAQSVGLRRASDAELLARAWELPAPIRNQLFEAGVRFGARVPTQADRTLIETTFNQLTKEKMMDTYTIDPRGLPADLGTPDSPRQNAWRKKLGEILEKSFGLDLEGNPTVVAVIAGILLLEERFDETAFDFKTGVESAWKETLGESRQSGQTEPVSNRELFPAIIQEIISVTHNDEPTVQLVASVSRYVLADSNDVPIGSPNFTANVRIAVDQYVSGPPTYESLTLPPLTKDDTASEVEPDNIKAIALWYAGYQLEKARLFHVVEAITERFLHGQLAIGFDNGGRALDTYYWNSEDRMNEAARRAVYSRVLGATGGDVPKDVAPNKDFDGLFMRFLASLAEFDRQRQVAGVFDTRQRPVSVSGEQVRKAGNDLAANASLYGWGWTHFAARRLNGDISSALNILKLPQIQRAYGVGNPWQVIERVAADEFGQAPNIVKYRTMAESGKAILDLVAKYARTFATSTGRPLFPDPNAPTDIPDIGNEDMRQFLTHTQYWLAVNGVTDQQVGQMSQPVESKSAPSLPPLSGGGGMDGGAMDKLKQMVTSGTAPSLDQLQTLLPQLRA